MTKQTVRRIRKSKGFTLIELLVVVLIIGILAAIAVPQYFKVVEKSKAAEANAWIAAVTGAQESYLNKMGTYCIVNGCLTAFDVGIPAAASLKYFDATMSAGAIPGGVDWQATMTRGSGSGGAGGAYYGAYTMVYTHSGNPPLTCSTVGSGACSDMLP